MRTNTEWRDGVMADVAAAEATAAAEAAVAVQDYLASVMGQPAYAYAYAAEYV
jgi:hypothetical protein